MIECVYVCMYGICVVYICSWDRREMDVSPKRFAGSLVMPDSRQKVEVGRGRPDPFVVNTSRVMHMLEAKLVQPFFDPRQALLSRQLRFAPDDQLVHARVLP